MQKYRIILVSFCTNYIIFKKNTEFFNTHIFFLKNFFFLVNENVKSFEILGNIQFLKMEPSKLINHFLGAQDEAAPILWYGAAHK